jgi:hypothetical protein
MVPGPLAVVSIGTMDDLVATGHDTCELGFVRGDELCIETDPPERQLDVPEIVEAHAFDVSLHGCADQILHEHSSMRQQIGQLDSGATFSTQHGDVFEQRSRSRLWPSPFERASQDVLHRGMQEDDRRAEKVDGLDGATPRTFSASLPNHVYERSDASQIDPTTGFDFGEHRSSRWATA